MNRTSIAMSIGTAALLASMIAGCALDADRNEPKLTTPATAPVAEGVVEAASPSFETVLRGNEVQVYASGVDQVQGAHFRLEYPSTVRIEAWRAGAPGGLAIASDTWPGSGEHLSVAWAEPLQAMNSRVLLGTLHLAKGSSGAVSVTAPSRGGDQPALILGSGVALSLSN